MTNEMIIFAEKQRLAEAGILGYTGREFKGVDGDGNEVVFKETEEIHTYNIWKEMGYQVRKGEHAITRITIWKHTAKVNEETGEEKERMFMKTAHFFSRSQVEEVKE